MAPKKKGNKRQEEDWEAELGETASQANGQTQEQEPGETPAEDGEGGGGLLAALRKNKTKKAKKGKPANDFVDGEEPEGEANGADEWASKEPEEATFDDDVFAREPKKGKQATKETEPKPEPEDEGFRMKSKKEKEKEKKEREKQRKKEQVSFYISDSHQCQLEHGLIPSFLISTGR